ncbi:phosphoribosyltransferase [Candidatus Woesearchaeota archaeon CG10_big_fil_rev_8_21_14_0_10_37_12]|nr:MAG: phosphoribosyltransferase [Candidatus Woesearchaeota archaeon CG10_big_fil_rev_8_21_14_0_10_37_12]
MMFKNRFHAAELLADKLKQYKNKKGAIILAIPRGGLEIGRPLANQLHLPLDIILTKKISSPRNSEVAIGSASLSGFFVNPDFDISEEYVNREVESIQQSLKQRYKQYKGNKKPAELKNKTVIIVDDGLATGHTMEAAIELIKQQLPKKLVVAVPVAPPSTARKIAKRVDEFICLATPFDFVAVGQFYEEFEQVSDKMLQKC